MLVQEWHHLRSSPSQHVHVCPTWDLSGLYKRQLGMASEWKLWWAECGPIKWKSKWVPLRAHYGPIMCLWASPGPHLGCPSRAQVTAHQKHTWDQHGNVGWAEGLASSLFRCLVISDISKGWIQTEACVIPSYLRMPFPWQKQRSK